MFPEPPLLTNLLAALTTSVRKITCSDRIVICIVEVALIQEDSLILSGRPRRCFIDMCNDTFFHSQIDNRNV
jgi:hypothetical protein